jgi:hypothetical protein
MSQGFGCGLEQQSCSWLAGFAAFTSLPLTCTYVHLFVLPALCVCRHV